MPLVARAAQRLLPQTWQGPGREAAWRRARARRVAAGLVAATAAVSTVAAVRPADEPTRAVVVAAHDVAAGTRLTAGDLRTVRWPVSVQTPTSATVNGLVGRSVITPLRSGEPVTATRLRGTRTLPQTAAGEVVVSVPLADPTLTSTVRVGDTVDAWSAQTGARIGSRLRVVATVTPSTPTAGRLAASAAADGPAAVLLAVPPAVASRFAQAQAGAQSPGSAVLLGFTPVT
ncbi:SAF domain-containing protein [Luteipulveratus halotolerans]|uniref:SAF domain-containing protein n=1 Tax=Luteipulveratus halotolerans TaxID=1631356 RepID=UPI0012F7A728|nr:SAF domain-containing protein [Luteipulveratus halotolerans]